MLLIAVERARPADLPRIRALLEAAGLPLDGADQAFETGVVARVGDEVVGAAAVEPFGPAGLLRSVVVAADHRDAGIGRRLVAAAEGLARESGIRDLDLPTETAIDWFPRLGYQVIPRDAAAAAVGQSIEFTAACATAAVAMRRAPGCGVDLARKRGAPPSASRPGSNRARGPRSAAARRRAEDGPSRAASPATHYLPS